MKKMNSKAALILSAASVLSFSTFAQALPTFGFPANNGYPAPSGQAGANGANAPSVQVVVNGQTQSFNLRGGDAGPGSNGYNAQPPLGCEQPRPDRYDTFGIDGERGGNAGPAGIPGNGGNITVYYKNIQDLKQIFVDASGGAGSTAGMAGAGAPGCGCTVPEWRIPRPPECHMIDDGPNDHHGGDNHGGDNHGGDNHGGDNHGGDNHGGDNHGGPHGGDNHPGPVAQPQPPHQHQECYQVPPEFHHCTPGRYGDNGTAYGSSANGSMGSALLINSLTPLTPTQPSTQIDLGSVPASATLTIDTWASANGAEALFAPGSQIADSYRYYAGRRTAPVSITWNARTNQQIARGEQVYLNLDTSGQVSAQLVQPAVWAELATTYDSQGAASISVNKAIVASDATRLNGKVYGTDSGVMVSVVDDAKVTDLVNTQIIATMTSVGMFSHTKVDHIQVPANLITANESALTVNLGQMYPSKDMGDLKKGKHLRIELSIVRSLGGQSATQVLSYDIQKLGQ